MGGSPTHATPGKARMAICFHRKTGKTPTPLQKRKCMKDNKLAIVYDSFDLQLTSCKKVVGVNIDDKLTLTSYFQLVSKMISPCL